MLVPAMTLPEIRKEVLKDLVIVKRKIVYVSEKISKLARKRHLKTHEHFMDYRSTQKNTWIFHFKYEHKEVYISLIIYFYGVAGLVALTIDIKDETLHYHTAHFFKRYNERRNLRLIKPEDILRAYIKDNTHISFQPLEKIATGMRTIFGVIETGIVLGYMNTNLNMIKLNTYITHEMLKGQQLKMEDYLKSKLSFYEPDFVKAE